MISWLLLILPWVDIFIGTNFIAYYTSDGLMTPLGHFSRVSANWYFISVFFNIMAVKGCLVCGRIAYILLRDYIAVNPLGQWGSSQDVGESYIPT
jgi:hypothetical protein